jgi:hypothetical protein
MLILYLGWLAQLEEHSVESEGKTQLAPAAAIS